MPDRVKQTVICPTCGCSLVRLGIGTEKASKREFEGRQYFFCCEGCAALFDEDPAAALEETCGLVVCPSCLAEKVPEHTVGLEYSGEVVSFCRCPHCVTVFLESPEHYLERLAGRTDFQGIFSSNEGCCGEGQSASSAERPAV